MHRLCRLLVLLLSEPAEGKETGTRGADGVAVRGGQPELAQQFAFASFPAERGLKLQAGAFCVILSAGVQAHLCGAQHGVVHLATVDEQGQANILRAGEYIPEQSGGRSADRNPVAVRGIHVLPGAGNRVEFGEESFVFGVDFVPPDGSAHAGGEGFPAESALDPASGFGCHERAGEQVNAGGCSGHIAAARVGSGDAQREIQGAAHAHRINARKVLTCGKNGGEIAPPGRNFGGGAIERSGVERSGGGA